MYTYHGWDNSRTIVYLCGFKNFIGKKISAEFNPNYNLKTNKRPSDVLWDPSCANGEEWQKQNTL